MKTKVNLQTIYDYLKNHKDLNEFEIKLDEYGGLEIIDKRTLDPYYDDTYKDYSLFISTIENKYCLKFVSALGYRDLFTSDDANKLHSKDIRFEIYKNMIYLYFCISDNTNLNQLIEHIKFMADYLLKFD